MRGEKNLFVQSSEDDLHAAAFLAKSLADENRLRILRAVSGEKKAVSRIVEELGISQPLVSHHLKELKRALLVTVERKGPFVYYQIADKSVLEIIAGLKDLAARLLEQRTRF
ncbi:ArsR/SmtB-type metalloregulator TsoR [Desulfolithobacter sp.]